MFENISDIEGKKFYIAEINLSVDNSLRKQINTLITTFGGQICGQIVFYMSQEIEFDYYIYGTGAIDNAARALAKEYNAAIVPLTTAMYAMERLDKNKIDLTIPPRKMTIQDLAQMVKEYAQVEDSLDSAAHPEQISIHAQPEDSSFQTTTFEFLDEKQARQFIEQNIKDINPLLIVQYARQINPVTINGVQYWDWNKLQQWLKNLHPEFEVKTSSN